MIWSWIVRLLSANYINSFDGEECPICKASVSKLDMDVCNSCGIYCCTNCLDNCKCVKCNLNIAHPVSKL